MLKHGAVFVLPPKTVQLLHNAGLRLLPQDVIGKKFCFISRWGNKSSFYYGIILNVAIEPDTVKMLTSYIDRGGAIWTLRLIWQDEDITYPVWCFEGASTGGSGDLTIFY